MSKPRQNYHSESESELNKQINLHLYSSYRYQAMSFYFDRDDIALPGFHKFFKKLSDEERCNAEKFMKFQNERGGRIILGDIKCPENNDWGKGPEAMEMALTQKKNLNQALLDLRQVAERHKDDQMCDWIDDNFLTKQVECIKEIADHMANLQRVGSGLGEYMFDKHSL